MSSFTFYRLVLCATDLAGHDFLATYQSVVNSFYVLLTPFASIGLNESEVDPSFNPVNYSTHWGSIFNTYGCSGAIAILQDIIICRCIFDE